MSWIDVTYLVRTGAADIASVAAALALEQSVEVPADVVRDDWVREHVMGRVAGIEPHDAGRFRVGIRLATATTGLEAAQAVNMLGRTLQDKPFGNRQDAKNAKKSTSLFRLLSLS